MHAKYLKFEIVNLHCNFKIFRGDCIWFHSEVDDESNIFVYDNKETLIVEIPARNMQEWQSGRSRFYILPLNT